MKKWLALLLAAVLVLMSTAAVAEIGTADAPVPVSILIKDVSPDDADTIAVVDAIEKGMAAQGNYVDITILEAPAGTYVEVVPLAFRTGEINRHPRGGRGPSGGPDLLCRRKHLCKKPHG